VAPTVGEALARARADLTGAVVWVEPRVGHDAAGLPFLVKDNLAVAGQPLACASAALEGYVPTWTATAVERLRAAGGVCIGRTNMDAFAMGSTTTRSVHGPTLHPLDPARVAGGSSGGSAAAVTAGIVRVALGSDTGGSVRQPAALCGVVGLKPTWGRVSRRGLVAFASSLDTVGIVAATVPEAAWALAAIAGPDPRDATCADLPVPDFADTCARGIAGLRVGVLDDADPGGVVAATGARLEAAAATLHARSWPAGLLDEAALAYRLLSSAEASSDLARYRSRAHGAGSGRRFGPRDAPEQLVAGVAGEEVARRLALGDALLDGTDPRLAWARAARARVTAALAVLLDGVDVLLGPSTPDPAFFASDAQAAAQTDRFLVPASLAGLPAISVPAGAVGGLPLGVHLVAPAWGEERILSVAARIGLG
jgi:aspartyl-tRNA(Asn)/glutamyl-tRNA(Gln) amidotransferase subunit A